MMAAAVLALSGCSGGGNTATEAPKSDSSTDNVGTSKGADVDRREESADTPKSDGSTENVNTTATSATDSQIISEASEN